MATSLLLPNPFKFKSKNPNPKFPKPHSSHTPKFSYSSLTTRSQFAKEDLLSLISDQDGGLKTQSNSEKRASIIKAIDAIAVLGAGSVTTDDSLSGTWRLLWTTEKEQLFIIEKAHLLGTQADDVLQVIDVQRRTLNNVIIFPPDEVFFVESDIEIESPQRVNLSVTREELGNPIATIWIGLVETVYLDNEILVAKDIRGDYLVVDHTFYIWRE